MFSSKVYRQCPSTELRRVEFLEFGEGRDCDGGVGLIAADFVEEAPVVPHESSVAPVQESAGTPQVDVDSLVAEAYARGRRESLAQIREDFGQSVEALSLAMEQLSALRESLLLDNLNDMKRLVMVIAEQVVGAVVEQDPDLILRTLKKALHFSVQSDEYQIRVSPDDFKAVTEKKPFFLSAISGLNNIVFESDPSISPGGCVVESELGEVDATIEAQLDEIRKNLLFAPPKT